jgi:hypothetical protein
LNVPNTEITRQIKQDQIYKIGTYSYKIMSLPDDISIPGLLIWKMEYSEVEQTLPSYSIEILNGELVSIQQGDNIQLNVQVKDGTTILSTPPSYLFTSSDESILTVNSNGLITSLSVGSAIVTCKLQSDESVYDSISITVKEIPVVETYTILISGSDSIKINQSSSYGVAVFNSLGVEIPNVGFVWSLDNVYATISSQDFSTCTVKAGSTSGKTVTLKTTKNDDPSVISEKAINIISLW